MTRKHFANIAKNLNLALRSDPNAYNAIVLLARTLATDFEAENPRFNRSKFLEVAFGEK
tara:strand:- start:56 stop:232 length:177 start_codon:yes stop_codon:yes gene_type:complete